jgi:hypothetical protein
VGILGFDRPDVNVLADEERLSNVSLAGGNFAGFGIGCR